MGGMWRGAMSAFVLASCMKTPPDEKSTLQSTLYGVLALNSLVFGALFPTLIKMAGIRAERLSKLSHQSSSPPVRSHCVSVDTIPENETTTPFPEDDESGPTRPRALTPDDMGSQHHQRSRLSTSPPALIPLETTGERGGLHGWWRRIDDNYLRPLFSGREAESPERPVGPSFEVRDLDELPDHVSRYQEFPAHNRSALDG
eukprot:CAMPEP_0204347296 /NCGR_PEP_ID=MMETSP0469-20131031/27837_1 /ASSEMBLY_ACC=CAM_ASM_000384 /TAXON_ID=2969 /ORGANISM="Oxyrrhis marina" /LENGTH=200 /DNA_ID=CAMNT_0051333079 /DNA_START=377 /DNA_END=979 /DNA_ORIENTATION=+